MLQNKPKNVKIKIVIWEVFRMTDNEGDRKETILLGNLREVLDWDLTLSQSSTIKKES